MLQERKRVSARLQLPFVLPINNLQEPIHLEGHCGQLTFPGSQIDTRKRDELLDWHGNGGYAAEEVHLGQVAAGDGPSVLDGHFKGDCISLGEGAFPDDIETFSGEGCVRAGRKIRLLIRS